MALNLQSLSITSVFNSIVNFFRSQENNSRWRDLTTGSEGSFLIRMLSNVFSAISYRIVAQSRENYLSTAALPSSNIGIAVNLGYSVSRGSNLKRLAYLTPNGNYTFPKLSVIGTYSQDYDIITLEDIELTEGVPTTVKTVVGKIKEESFTTGTSDIKVFSLFTTGISEDYILYLDSTEVPTTDKIKEMRDDKYLVRTNPYSSVDIAYLNSFPGFQYKYGTGSEITIRYVELADVEVQPYTADMFTYGTLTNVGTISNFTPFETVEDIKVNAPIDYEVQNLIRSKADYAYRLREEVAAVKEVNWEALTPTYTLITYLKDDLTLLTEEETESFKEILKQENYFGTPLPDITPPRREVAFLNIQLKLTSKYKNIADVNLDVQNIIDNFYTNTLGVTLNIYDLERELEKLSYVKYARVGHVLNDRIAGQNYQLGYILNKDDKFYMAIKILGTSGNSEPNWNVPVNPLKQVDTGLETADGTLYWRAYKRLPNMDSLVLTEWESNTQYGIGDYVYSNNIPGYMFKCVDLVKSSGNTAPDLTYVEMGDFVVDGNIVWVVKDYNELASSRVSLRNYRLGDIVNVSTSGNTFSLECVSYTGTVGTLEDLEFEEDAYTVIDETSSTLTVEGDKTFYFRPNDIISAAYSGGYDILTVENAVLNNGNTVITVRATIDTSHQYTTLTAPERGTKDGQILWDLIPNIDEVTYNWNAYVTFDHELEILE